MRSQEHFARAALVVAVPRIVVLGREISAGGCHEGTTGDGDGHQEILQLIAYLHVFPAHSACEVTPASHPVDEQPMEDGLERMIEEKMIRNEVERLELYATEEEIDEAIGMIAAENGLTVAQLREVLDEQYGKFYEEPAIDVTPVKTNTLAEDIRNAVGGQSGFNQQALNVRVMPDGKIRLPGIGEVTVQGFTLNQLKKEINLRYDEIVVGINTEPILSQQAPHFVHVMGQVATPNRIQLEGPTTVLGAISAAGGHLPAGNMRQVVIFRRAEDWRLISTMLDLQGAVYGKRPTPADEIWLRDGDVIIVPDKPITRFNNWAQQIFTDGIYRIFPIQFEDVRL